MSDLPMVRPESTELDRKYMLAVTTVVGPVKAGIVLAVDQEIGTGYVKESSTGKIFALIRKLVSSESFDAVHVGDRVKFQENGRRAILHLKC